MTSETINLIKNHKSIRKFKKTKISLEMINLIFDSAISASSSCFFQCISIIHIEDDEKRKKLVNFSGNKSYVAESSDFFIFCLDYARHNQIAPHVNYGNVERIINASIDAGIIGQNTLLAAQSLGLGGVFIGGIRNEPNKVCELLKLPKYVFPLMGLCLGVPDQLPEKKPRLPKDILIHKNSYKNMDNRLLNEYDKTSEIYYSNRTENKKSQCWSSNIKNKLQSEERSFMKNALISQGLMTN